MPSPTLKDVYDVVNRLEDKVDKRLDCMEREHTNRVSAIEIRTDALELWKSNITGKISVIGAIAGTIMGVIVSLITGFLSKKL